VVVNGTLCDDVRVTGRIGGAQRRTAP